MESVECGGGVMMVDGSHGTIPPPPHRDNSQQQQSLQPIKSPVASTSTATTASFSSPADISNAIPSTSVTPLIEEATVTSSSRSRWMKLRTTVQLSSAITQGAKKPPLKREDSFLKRFSTRPIPDPNAIEGSSRLAGEGIMKSPFLGVWRSVVNPDENILFYWLSLLTICLLYNAWTIIVRQAFPELQEDWSTMWYCLDSFTDIVFTLDIAFQFRTGYLEQGLMVCESKKLACHYIKSKSFILDIAAIIPLDLIQLRFGAIPILRFPRQDYEDQFYFYLDFFALLHVYYFSGFKPFLKLYRSFRLYYMVESRTIYPNLWRVVNLIHILLLLAHWFGCFYYLLSELEDFVGEWSYRKPINDYATLSRKYLGSVYWSTLTLTTIGDLATPATNLQYMFTIISYLIGVFIFATIVGQVGTVITNRNASRLEFERLLDGAKLYMRHHKVPRNMQRRVQRWYDYSWSRGRMQGGGDINSALGILPDKLKTELALHVNLKTLKKVSIFQECQPEFLHDLVLKMRAYIFTPGDLICRKGEVAREMFIIADGILEVISETGKVLTQMKAGDFFGEIGILNLDGFNRRTADVRSVGYSELFSLSREDILAAMKDYPEAQDILQTMGRKRLMEARLAANISAKPGPSEPNLPSSSQEPAEGERTEAAKPRSTVSKIKEDVRSLKKRLRNRSSTAGNTSDSGETIEMKPMMSDQEGIEEISESQPTTRKKNVSFKSLIQKIQFKRDDSTTSVKSSTEKLGSFRKGDKNCVESSSVSTDDSADSSTPLNKSLPLLQRVRLLGAQEKKSEMQQQQQASASPPTKRFGIFRSVDHSQDEEEKKSPKKEKELTGKEEQQPPSPKSKSNPFSKLTSVIPKGSTSPKSPKKSPKKEPSQDGKKSPVALKGRLNDTSSELPLLKKVLLRKVMDDKKAEESQLENQNQPGPSNCSNDPQFKVENDLNNENNEQSQENVSNRVYLEQFSRTLGFKMSEDITPAAKTPSRPRLNASSLTPSPSSENVPLPSMDQKQEDAEKEQLVKSTSPPKGRLSRMMAVREDSDENSVLAEDPFVKSTECQTEISGSVKETHNDTETNPNESEADIALRDYLKRMISDLETAIKAYSLEQQQDLLKENTLLKQNQDNQDNFIKKLLSKLEETQTWETFEEVSSLGASSISVSEIKEENPSVQNHSPVDPYDDMPPFEYDEEDRDLEDEEVMALQERLKHQRKSWPTSVSIRRKLPTRQSCSLDDENQDPEESESTELWRLEFPPPPPDMNEAPWVGVSKSIYPTVPVDLIEEVIQTEDERLQSENGPAPKTTNDWEVRMLIEQFEENVVLQRETSSRRHSSGEALTWDKVLRLRNTVRTRNEMSGMSDNRSGRKYSLVEGSSSTSIGAMCNWVTTESSSSVTQSTSYTSLTNLDDHKSSVASKMRYNTDSTLQSNFESQSNHGPPRGRKNSLPILPMPSSACNAHWLSMEDVKDNENHEYNHQTSVSSSCSQETVVEMDVKSSSAENVHCHEKVKLSTRSPSSPNVAADRESHMPLDFSAASNLSDWPSSPCLPTIREDEQCSGTTSTHLKSSSARSISHDCLPKRASLPVGKQGCRTISSHSGNPEPFHSLETVHDTTDQELENRDNVILNLDLQNDYYQETTLDNQYRPNIREASNLTSRPTLSSTSPLKDNAKSISQNNVVITIPKCESVLSP
ncbi:cyclic nucleotide-gated cation channel alpha-3 [Nephila pilipes]|uniref:Cyclic nucleotide-gated cation channel alpha-3 n=1 Tax=Nephila pilipes TaxID=299642 RepID=A0A8X6QGJ7_NEPPI|nr:cyclic nucleotide-gated cation channel alpha-3 [Nephila pilipes]